MISPDSLANIFNYLQNDIMKVICLIFPFIIVFGCKKPHNDITVITEVKQKSSYLNLDSLIPKNDINFSPYKEIDSIVIKAIVQGDKSFSFIDRLDSFLRMSDGDVTEFIEEGIQKIYDQNRLMLFEYITKKEFTSIESYLIILLKFQHNEDQDFTIYDKTTKLILSNNQKNTKLIKKIDDVDKIIRNEKISDSTILNLYLKKQKIDFSL